MAPAAGDVTMAKIAAGDVYSALRLSILDGGIAPGTRINIDAVSLLRVAVFGGGGVFAGDDAGFCCGGLI